MGMSAKNKMAYFSDLGTVMVPLFVCAHKYAAAFENGALVLLTETCLSTDSLPDPRRQYYYNTLQTCTGCGMTATGENALSAAQSTSNGARYLYLYLQIRAAHV